MESLREHRLGNGLTLLGDLMPDRHVVAFCLALPAGFATEDPARRGLSSIAAGMLLRGTTRRDSRALSDALDSLGLQRGEAVDCEFIEFHGALGRALLGPALDLYAEMLRSPAFPEDQLAAEREQGLQAIAALADDPGRRLMVELRRQFILSAHGESSLGTPEGIRAIVREDLVRDHLRRMCPCGGMLAVAGGFDWTEVVKRAERLFGDWRGNAPAPEAVRLRDGPWETRIHQETAQEHIGLAFPGVALGDPDFYPLRLAIGVLSGGMSGRLVTEVREKRGLAYAVGASLWTLPGAGVVCCYAGTTPDRADETAHVLDAELARLADGVAPPELERARIGILSALVMDQESSLARASAMVSDYWQLGRVRPLGEIQAAYRAVAVDQVDEVLRRRAAAPRTVVRLGPGRTGAPRQGGAA